MSPQTHDIWSFIQSSKATNSASLNLLQQFILSLSKHELRHLIELYLKSIITSHHNEHGLTYQQSEHAIIHKETTHLHSLDQSILNKMQQNYGNKYNKKIVRKMQQKQHQNKHVLSINPQILASSFQYLSFRELCQIQPTCLYFTYLHKTYPSLCHYHLNMNTKFFQHALLNKVNLDNLQKFKHIRVGTLYTGRCHASWDKNVTRRASIFDVVIKRTIEQSLSCLDVLHLDLARIRGPAWDYDFPCGLWQILHSFPELPISTLIWKGDMFRFRFIWNEAAGSRQEREEVDIHSVLTEMLCTQRFPRLQHFHFDGTLFAHRTKYVISRVLKTFKHTLKSLTVNSPTYDTFRVALQHEMPCLHTLCIRSLIENDSMQEQKKKVEKNTSIKQLTLQFYLKTWSEAASLRMQHILNKLFSNFIGLERFEYGFARITDGWRSGPIISTTIQDWREAFHLLFQQKTSYALQSGPQNANVSSLQSVDFTVTNDEAVAIMDALRQCCAEKYCNLTHFGMNVMCTARLPYLPTHHAWRPTSSVSHREFADLITSHFIPLLTLGKIQQSLKSVQFQYGTPYKRYLILKRKNVAADIKSGAVKVEESYMDPVLSVLRNLPKTVRRISFAPPLYSTQYSNAALYEIKQKEHKRLIQKLCAMLPESKEDTEPNADTELEAVVLQNMRFGKHEDQYLRFMFGYNGNFHRENGIYHFTFYEKQ